MMLVNGRRKVNGRILTSLSAGLTKPTFDGREISMESLGGQRFGKQGSSDFFSSPALLFPLAQKMLQNII